MSTPEQNPSHEQSPVEIERKFLVAALPENLEAYPHTAIRQGYAVIGTDGSEIRVRDQDGSFTLTVKSKGDLVRGETEVDLSEEQFAKLWPTTRNKRVEKTRYALPWSGATIELDIYNGNLGGLVTAEVEFPDETTASYFEAPPWFGAEVTSNKVFKNQQLALRGIPEGTTLL